MSTSGHRPPRSSKRGLVYGLSRKSARRLRERLIALPFDDYSVAFAALTWHMAWPDDHGAQYRALSALLVKARATWRAYGLSGYWRKEYQRRGAPHYHLVIVTKRKLPTQQFRYWLAVNWNQVAAPGDMAHLRAGTQFDQLRIGKHGLRKSVNYLANYSAKPEQNHRVDITTGEILPTGRVWGRFYNPPAAIPEEVGLDWGGWHDLQRRIRQAHPESGYCQAIGRRYNNALIYCSKQEALDLLADLDQEYKAVPYGLWSGPSP